MRALRVGAVGVLAGLVLAGCGGSGGDGAEAVETVKPIDLLAAVEGTGSVRWEASVDARIDDTGLGLGATSFRVVGDIEGATDYEAGASESRLTMRFEVDPPEGAVDEPAPAVDQHVETREVGDESWQREWAGDDEPGPWVAMDWADEEVTVGDEADEPEEDGRGGMAGAEPAPDEWEPAPDEEEVAEEPDDLSYLLDPTQLDPATVVEALRDLVPDLAAVGDEELDGVRATRYEGSLALAGSEDAALWPEGTERGTVEVWLDEQGRLRRAVAGGLELRMWDFGADLAIAAPSEVADDDEVSGFGGWAEVTGEWREETRAEAGGRTWALWAAPGVQQGTEVVCRTLEEVGAPATEADDALVSLPTHGGALATCGAGGFALFFAGTVSDPAVQVLSPARGFDEVGPVGFVVSPRFRSGPVRIVLAEGEVVELPVDGAGLALWDPEGDPAVEAVELDGGGVRCPVPVPEDEEAGPWALVYGLGPCVRA